jgi:hypothetical protein
MLVLNMGETDLSRVPMATDGPDVTDEALLVRLGLHRHSLALSKGFQKCAFRNCIWRIVPSKIVIFIRQMASCLHRQLTKCKFLIANGE